MQKLSKCPTCGSSEIKQVRRSWTGTFRGQPYTVPNVRFYECPDCGEKVFDPEAVDKIEAHRPKRKKGHSRLVGSG